MEKHKKINESITTSISGFSEFSDHDEDFIQFSKKLQEKEEEVENLRKEMRALEFTYKKSNIELENERNFWKMKAENINENIANQSIVQLANELQTKLSEKEREILSLKEKEIQLKQQIFSLKENNIHLKNTSTRHKSFSIDTKAFLKIPDKLTITSKVSGFALNKIDESAEYTKANSATHELLFNLITNLKEEKKALEENLDKIKEIAIESVVEKEKELIELKNRYEESEISFRNQIEIANNELELFRMKLKYVEGDSEASSPKHAASLIQFRALETELEAMKKLYRDEKILFLNDKEMLEGRIKELISENEQQQNEFNKRIDVLNREMDNEIYKKVREDTQNVKDMQQQLLKELQNTEEKYRELQKKHAIVQQEIRALQTAHEKENHENLTKIKELSNKIKCYESSEQAKLELEKKNEGEKRKLLLEIEQKSEKIQNLESKKLELSKKLSFLEGELTQYKMKNVLLKENYDNLKTENEDLKVKWNEDFRNFQSSIAELDLKYSQEKEFLELELRKMKEMYEPDVGKSMVINSLQNEMNHLISSEETSNKKTLLEIPMRGSYSPSPNARVSILESYDKEDIVEKEDIEKLVAESQVYLDLRNQIEEKNEKIEELQMIIEELNEKNQRLVDNYTIEIKELHERQKTHLDDLQDMRKTFILKSEETPKEIENNKEIQRLKMEIIKFQTSLNENKQIFENELTFLKNEIANLEEKLKFYKEEYSQVLTERDTYIQKYNQLITAIKKKKQALQNSESTGSLFGLRLSLFRR